MLLKLIVYFAFTKQMDLYLTRDSRVKRLQTGCPSLESLAEKLTRPPVLVSLAG